MGRFYLSVYVCNALRTHTKAPLFAASRCARITPPSPVRLALGGPREGGAPRRAAAEGRARDGRAPRVALRLDRRRRARALDGRDDAGRRAR
eukprot:947650-Prymnesium_polylepis.1